MVSKLFAHLRRQWMGALALFLVLSGGTAYAVNEWTGANIVDGSLTSADYKNNDIRSVDVRNDNVAGGGLQSADIAPDSLTGNDVADNSLAGVDIEEPSLNGVGRKIIYEDTAVDAQPKTT